ncbi:galactokinase [Anoxybacillus kestanbolensis]|uniref:galactokinase n=1 Tax=Anoxybacillus kestanbolensis TaxID=227476 RepID=UPI00208DCF49|nr:galactokinase [Anoxybacillus kestanbolensis]MCL9969928.1 galactokinase [Anoxybacillus kestanbolensis]
MNELVRDFIQLFGQGEREAFTFFAPGRVNLIGEHTDYNGGYVLPCSLHIGTYVVARLNDDGMIRLYSKNFHDDGIVSIRKDELAYDDSHGWANYPKGIIRALMPKDVQNGIDVLYYGNIPNGAGLSSSASIELVTAVMLNHLFQLNIEMLELVKISQQVENEYIGVNCGIMDQFAVGMGKAGHALLLDCQTLQYEYLPLSLEDCSIVIANTNKKRGLADSAYNERRATCEQALAKLQHYVRIHSLGDLTTEQFHQYAHVLSPIEQKRVRHVVSENERTKQAAFVLRHGDLHTFGQLMRQSHESLRDDYEVTGKELDTLVEAAWKHKGTIGARMTGAGFGGCTVNIVKDDHIPSFIEEVRKMYEMEIGYAPSFYVAKIGDGAKQLTKEGEGL